MEKEIVLSTLLVSGSIRKTANELGCSVSALYKMLDDTEFKQMYASAKNKLLQSACDTMRCNLEKATNVLINIIDNSENSSQVRVNAIDCLFRNYFRANEQSEILTRITDVEKRLNNE